MLLTSSGLHVEAEVIRVENDVTLKVVFTQSVCPDVESLKGLHSNLSTEQTEI
jgi:hypothetical protein